MESIELVPAVRCPHCDEVRTPGQKVKPPNHWFCTACDYSYGASLAQPGTTNTGVVEVAPTFKACSSCNRDTEHRWDHEADVWSCEVCGADWSRAPEADPPLIDLNSPEWADFVVEVKAAILASVAKPTVGDVMVEQAEEILAAPKVPEPDIRWCDASCNAHTEHRYDVGLSEWVCKTCGDYWRDSSPRTRYPVEPEPEPSTAQKGFEGAPRCAKCQAYSGSKWSPDKARHVCFTCGEAFTRLPDLPTMPLLAQPPIRPPITGNLYPADHEHQAPTHGPLTGPPGSITRVSVADWVKMNADLSPWHAVLVAKGWERTEVVRWRRPLGDKARADIPGGAPECTRVEADKLLHDMMGWGWGVTLSNSGIPDTVEITIARGGRVFTRKGNTMAEALCSVWLCAQPLVDEGPPI